LPHPRARGKRNDETVHSPRIATLHPRAVERAPSGARFFFARRSPGCTGTPSRLPCGGPAFQKFKGARAKTEKRGQALQKFQAPRRASRCDEGQRPIYCAIRGVTIAYCAIGFAILRRADANPQNVLPAPEGTSGAAQERSLRLSTRSSEAT